MTPTKGWQKNLYDGRVFVEIKSALLRTPRNYHRLASLGQRGPFQFHEETITDLLVAEMTGGRYEISGGCPECHEDRCDDWHGSGITEGVEVQIQPMTKIQEGGNKDKKAGTAADFVLAITRQNSKDFSQVRLMVQAKRVSPETKSFLKPREVAQHNKLLRAAQHFKAAPYYALYVQQPSAHERAATRCTVRLCAADVAIVLAPAVNEGLPGYLPGKSFSELMGLARPLSCLAGCACSTGTPGADHLDTTAYNFVKDDFDSYEPARPEDSLPDGPSIIALNPSTYRPKRPKRRTSTGSQRSSANGKPFPDMLVLRLGAKRSVDDGRRFAGWSSEMSEKEVADATRMYWILDLAKAHRLRYLVASSKGIPREVYRITEDGPMCFEEPGVRRRIGFDVRKVENTEDRDALLARARRALQILPKGSRTPTLYA